MHGNWYLLQAAAACCAIAYWLHHAAPAVPAVQYDESHRESLLNAANAKRAHQTLNNLRMSCNVAGNCVLQAGLFYALVCFRLMGRVGSCGQEQSQTTWRAPARCRWVQCYV